MDNAGSGRLLQAKINFRARHAQSAALNPLL
jgi:hypothetical protein